VTALGNRYRDKSRRTSIACPLESVIGMAMVGPELPAAWIGGVRLLIGDSGVASARMFAKKQFPSPST